MDGPQARMTASAIASERRNQVPLLYEFALEADAIPHSTNGTSTSTNTLPPHDTIAEKQAALTRVTNWPAVTAVGEAYIDKQCDNFIAALNDLERSRKTTLADLNSIQAATVGIMGLAIAAQKTIGIVGIAFGLAANLFDTTTSTVLYNLPATGVSAVVNAQRVYLRLNETGTLQNITNQGLASARLSRYVQYCSPVTIEENIAKILSNTKGSQQGLEISSTSPVVTLTTIHGKNYKPLQSQRSQLVHELRTLTGPQITKLARAINVLLPYAPPNVTQYISQFDPKDIRTNDSQKGRELARNVLTFWAEQISDPNSILLWQSTITSIKGE